MRFCGVKKMLEGKFIHRYDLQYEAIDGTQKTYEMISRNGEIKDLDTLQSKNPDAVVLIMHDQTGERLLLNREYRMAVGEPVYNFPAGLIDAGETPAESAKRELWEETGLELVEIQDVLPLSYSAVGFSNESNVCIVGVAAGEFAESTSVLEEIQAGWFTKQEVKELLKTEKFAARTQAYCYMWSKN